MTAQLTSAIASKFATLALDHLTREYPNKLTHSLAGPQDVQGPRALHPVFYGSYDWHSCVHGYWLVLRLIDRFPDLPEAKRIVATVDEHFTEANVAGEMAYLDLPHNRGFERPYGWAWLLTLAAQVQSMTLPQAATWTKTIAPLTQTFVDRFEEFLPKSTYPLRVGTHFNTAFALSLALDFARRTGHDSLAALIVDTSKRWYLQDAACQAWEPSGDEFLSPSLMEAELMRRVLPSAEFVAWFARFLPDIAERKPATLFVPRHRDGPHGRQDRAPRRIESQPRMVSTLDCAGAAFRRYARRRAIRSRRHASGGCAGSRRRRLYGRTLARGRFALLALEA